MSIVTIVPNASVAPVHDRMPLVLGPGESSVWMNPSYPNLVNRNEVVLVRETES